MRLFAGSFKSSGGWSLEMKDPRYPCAGHSNWAYSNDPSGGTPGRANSAAEGIPEPPLPGLLRSTTPDSQHVRLHFSAPIDSATASAATYEGRSIRSATPERPEFTTILLELGTPWNPERSSACVPPPCTTARAGRYPPLNMSPAAAPPHAGTSSSAKSSRTR